MDRKRYEEQMAQYQPPDKQPNHKRNKSGYNMFFSAHVRRLKQTEAGIPSEPVTSLVSNAWRVRLAVVPSVGNLFLLFALYPL